MSSPNAGARMRPSSSTRFITALNHFCAVDLSSLYIDITKDRMYCDAPDSPRRRATQFAMHKIFDALCRLLAPILVFTAEEAWGYAAASGGSRSASQLLSRAHGDVPETGEARSPSTSKSSNC